jgi:hypothetical protein
MNVPAEPNPPVFVQSSRHDQSYYLVLFSGVATSALALLGVYLLDISTDDFHIMGWYADYVIPAGAVLVGLVASSGYGLASWLTGVKINRSLLGAVLTLQLIVYFAALYIEFSHLHLMHRNGVTVGFFEYYDLVARSFAWRGDNGKPGEPLGVWGYAFRLLEIAGFVGGSLIVPAALLKAPYCQACRRYMRSRQLSLMAASVPVKKLKKADTEGRAAHQAEQEQAFAQGVRLTEILQQMSAGGQTAEFRETLAKLEPGRKQAARLPIRISLHLVACKKCRSGWLQFKRVTGQGKHIKSAELARSGVGPEFVHGLDP